ncbi:aldo/keto reductase family protein [Mariniplasma anaerobium]|uniref:Putative reductase / dehydrogenase n=1 Tax=Mariniplasma anaerobium TaxID=2735436 RepID=A0A7R7V6A2_9MOLU|nr:aldo/keto reductase [Mariniplasma anaerobium]BCR35228.1 putative reductase / dehydrogenase [Mariniplasma anaerobium]
MKYLKMNNGLTIPVLGTGTNTFGKENNNFNGKITYDTKELISAIELGYRLIDTAIYYRNEAVIGKAVKESNIDRSKFFITSKIPQDKEFIETNELVKHHIEQSLNLLDIDYIDLYLIHFPFESNEENLRVWRILETFVDRGLIKSIGVSNFNEDQLAYLIKHASIKPVLNQFQSYPGKHQQSLIDYCKANDIIPQAYQSLAKVEAKTKDILIELAKPYNKSWSQIILNYQINEGLVVIPKSHSKQHQFENMDVFDFKLTQKDIKTIKNI